MRYRGKLYRALNPIWARDPLSGRGAELYRGRFNARGVPTLYTSLSVVTAIREANQVGDLQPTTLIAYDAEVEAVADSRDDTLVASYGMDPAALGDPGWRDAMVRVGEAPTQIFARRLAADGYQGMLVRSFAAGATGADLNLVLWRWGAAAPSRVRPIDDEGRLSRQPRRSGR